MLILGLSITICCWCFLVNEMKPFPRLNMFPRQKQFDLRSTVCERIVILILEGLICHCIMIRLSWHCSLNCNCLALSSFHEIIISTIFLANNEKDNSTKPLFTNMKIYLKLKIVISKMIKSLKDFFLLFNIGIGKLVLYRIPPVMKKYIVSKWMSKIFGVNM